MTVLEAVAASGHLRHATAWTPEGEWHAVVSGAEGARYSLFKMHGRGFAEFPVLGDRETSATDPVFRRVGYVKGWERLPAGLDWRPYELSCEWERRDERSVGAGPGAG